MPDPVPPATSPALCVTVTAPPPSVPPSVLRAKMPCSLPVTSALLVMPMSLSPPYQTTMPYCLASMAPLLAMAMSPSLAGFLPTWMPEEDVPGALVSMAAALVTVMPPSPALPT